MSLFGRKAVRSAPPPSPSLWSFASLGDDSGSIVEDTVTTLTIDTAGTGDPDNGQFAYQTINSGDIQLIGRVPASWTGGTPENFTFFGVQIREALTGTPVLAQCAWPNIGSVRGKHRLVTDDPVVNGYATGISGQSLPRYVGITYDDSESEIRYWESANNSDWFQVGETVSLSLSYPVYAGIYGVSHDAFQRITATMTVCTVTPTITITEAPPVANRSGILQELTFASTAFEAYGVGQVDSAAFRTYDSADNSYQDETSGGIWDSSWDMTRVDIFTEESVSGPVDDNFLRQRLRYDQDYSEINGGGINKPRNNLQWGVEGNGVRYADDREFWLSWTWYIPSSYVADSSVDGNQEVLLQHHNASGGSGHGNIQLGGNGAEQGRLNVNLQVSDTTDEASGANEQNEAHVQISDLLGQFVTFVFQCRFNPFSSNTTVDASMGRFPQIGESFLANQGIFNGWMSVPPGVTVVSNTLGNVTNGTLDTQMMQICSRNNEPVGLVPSWRNGVSGQDPLLHEFNIYKGQWMQQLPFASRPSIPHDRSSKSGPIVLYLGQVRMGDESSDYQSVHPTQEAQP